MAEAHSRRRRKKHEPGWGGWRTDLSVAFTRLSQRTSRDHKRFVAVVLVLGAILRMLRMNEAVTYDEAATFVHYADRSFGFLISDHLLGGGQVLYSLLARLSTLIFGAHAWSLRLPALIAGLLVLPLCYAFCRFVFNRHVAVIMLCLVAVSGPLVEYSAMAQGYSLVWLFTLSALLAARHFVRSENLVSAFLLALFCALGMWASPHMIYPAVMVYTWALFMLVESFQSTIRRRVFKLAGSAVMAVLLLVLLYAPVLFAHSLDQLLHPPSAVEHTWARFVNTHQDRAFELWAYFTGTASTVLAFAGAVAVIYAAYVSFKYRSLLFALLIGTVPLVILKQFVAPPAAWTFSLLVLHMGTAIGLFYLLKVIRDKLAPKFSKSQRTLVAGAVVLVLFGWAGVRGEGDTIERFPEARSAAAWLAAHSTAKDRVCAQLPWDAPLRFYLHRERKRAASALRPSNQAPRVYVLVAPGHGQTPEGVLRHDGQELGAPLKPLGEWGRLELYGTR